MSPVRLAIVLLLLAGPAAAETAPARSPGARTVTVPRTTVTVEETPTVSQPGAAAQPAQPTPRRRARRPANAGATGNNGYSSFLTGPIDLRRPPQAQ